MNKLPPPYDKKCHDFSQSQQFECMNQCIEQHYNQKLKCFPNKNNYHTILVDNQISKKNIIFCNDTEYDLKLNEYFALSCQYKCGEPCSIIYFDEDLIPTNMYSVERMVETEKYIELIIDNVNYLKIKWLPQLTLISLMIKIFNIWNLWHGIHFKLLIDLILNYFTQVYSYIFRNIVINIHWNNYINYEIIKVRIS